MINKDGVCMTLTEIQFQDIATKLEHIQELYQKILKMDYQAKDKLIVETMILLIKSKEELNPIKEACEDVLNQFSHGVNYFETTLVDEVIERLKPPYKMAMPKTHFDRDILIYKWYDQVIKEEFDGIYSMPLDRRNKMIVDWLWRGIHCALVDNPNFKGPNPYYKRYYHEYDRAKKITLECLDKDFKGYISYFKGE